MHAVGLNEKQLSERATSGKSRDLVRKIREGHRTGKGPFGTNPAWTIGLAVTLECSVEFLSGHSDEIGDPPSPALMLPAPPRPKTRAESPPIPKRYKSEQSGGGIEGLGLAYRAPVTEGELLPVRFVVQAGAWFEVDEVAHERIVSPPVAADPRFPREAQWVELVRGDSADKFYPEGSFVHVVDAISIGYRPQRYDFVIVERKREQGGLVERSLKQVRVRPKNKIELWPCSHNPKWRTPLQFGAPHDEDDGARIAALVIGGYLPARRGK